MSKPSSKDTLEKNSKFRNIFALPPAAEARITLDFANIARTACQAASILYKKGMYLQAAYFLQQSVEKSVKSFGLMVGIIKPSDLRSVSHYSIYSLLLGLNNFVKYIQESASYLLTATQEIESLPQLSATMQKVMPLIPSSDKVNNDKRTFDNLEAKEMWRVQKTSMTRNIEKSL